MKGQISIEYLIILVVMILLFYAISMSTLNKYIPKTTKAAVSSVAAIQNKTLTEMYESLSAFESGCLNTSFKVPPYCSLKYFTVHQPVRITALYYMCSPPISASYVIGPSLDGTTYYYCVNGCGELPTLKEGDVYNVSICKSP